MTRSDPSDIEGFLSPSAIEPSLHRIVEPDGSYDETAVPDLSADEFRDLYRWMLLQRTFDDRAIKLQRRGNLGTYASGRGQEASIIGAAFAIDDADWLLPYGREAGALIMHGVSMRDLILYWRGIEDASRMAGANVLGVAISIGSQLPMATGVGWGMKLAGADSVAVPNFGDGATSTGAFHEGINLGGVLGVQAVYLCQNNQYAISLPFEEQTAAETVAQKAIGYGMDAVRVDGNDVLAVYDAMDRARRLALKGRPVLVEAVTYRRAAHTTSDDPRRYRDEAEVADWRDRDPIDRYEAFLRGEGYWAEIDPEAVRDEVAAEFDDAVEAADGFEERAVEEAFAYVYESMPPELRRQLDSLEEMLDAVPDLRDHIEQRPKG